MSEHRRYEILNVLGVGGFGTVYRARFVGEGGFSKEVALKVLKPDMEGVADVAQRLRDEARVLGLLRHRAIVQVDRLTQLDGRWTVVMEYIEGQDLSKLIRLGPLPPGPALEITAEVAGALHAANTRPGPNGQPLRLVHRDLKPSNIRLTTYGEVKVLDFGIARAEFEAREALTRSLSFGTPDYMSPERLDHQGDTPAGDVYALGLVLLEMVVGRRLGRSSANAERHAIRMDEARFMLNEAKVPEALGNLVMECLAYSPAQRPSADDLERRCLALSRELGPMPLRAWAEEAMARLPAPRTPNNPPILASLTPPSQSHGSRPQGAQTPGAPAEGAGPALATSLLESVHIEAEDLTGSVMVEGPAPQTLPVDGIEPSAAPASDQAARRFIPGAVIVALVLMVGILLWRMNGQPDPVVPEAPVTAPAQTAPQVQPETPPQPVEASPSPADQPSAPVAAPAPAVKASSGTPKKSEPSANVSPAPGPAEPVPPASTQVSVSGEGAFWLVPRGGGTKISLPGSVAPGDYEVRAKFEGRDEEKMMNLAVGTTPISISCGATFGCRKQ